MCSIITHIITRRLVHFVPPVVSFAWLMRIQTKEGKHSHICLLDNFLWLWNKNLFFFFKTTSSVKSTLSSSPWHYKLGLYATSIAWHRAINLFTHFPQTSPQWFRFLFPISSLSASLSTSSMWMSSFFIIIIRLQETFVKTSSIAAFFSVCFNSSINL